MASDNYDDRGRGGYDDRDRGRGGYDDGGDPVAAAKRKVGAPAILLIISGVIGIGLGGYGVYQAFTNPYAAYEGMVKLFEAVLPPGADRDKVLEKLAADREQMRGDSPMNLGSLGLGLVLSVLGVVGGFSMKSLGSRGLAMTGAIAAVIPLGWCCLLTMPVGIWAIVVLGNPVVKRAFDLKAGARPTGPAPTDDDPRWSDTGR